MHSPLSTAAHSQLGAIIQSQQNHDLYRSQVREGECSCRAQGWLSLSYSSCSSSSPPPSSKKMSPVSFSLRLLMVSLSYSLLISPRCSCSSRSNSSCSRCSFYACGERTLRAATKSRAVLVASITLRPAVGDWPNNSSRTCFLFSSHHSLRRSLRKSCSFWCTNGRVTGGAGSGTQNISSGCTCGSTFGTYLSLLWDQRHRLPKTQWPVLKQKKHRACFGDDGQEGGERVRSRGSFSLNYGILDLITAIKIQFAIIYRKRQQEQFQIEQKRL